MGQISEVYHCGGAVSYHIQVATKGYKQPSSQMLTRYINRHNTPTTTLSLSSTSKGVVCPWGT